MSNRLFTLDTPILIYAINKDAGDKHKVSRNIVEMAMQGGCTLTLQALSEFYVATTRKNYLSHQQATHIINDFMRVFPIICATARSLDKALQLKTKYHMQFWDALILATVREAQCNLMITEDFQHQQNIEGIKFFNPFQEHTLAEFLQQELS